MKSRRVARRPAWGVKRRGVVAGLMLAALMWVGPAVVQAADWPPITPEELALKDDPLRPGAAAIILYREIFTDHNNDTDTEFYRIKILTEEGKKYANIELPFVKGIFEIKDVEARTLRPNGQVVPFAGQLFEKTVIKSRGVKVLVKALTLPEVEVGSIVEYRYKLRWQSGWTRAWVIQEELTLRRGRFTLRPASGVLGGVRWIPYWLGDKQLQPQGGDYVLVVQDVPAFQEEEFSLPADIRKMRVRFFYVSMSSAWPETYWNELGRKMYEENDKFIGKRKAIEREVAGLVSPNDSPEVKLRKLYARAQQIRNLGYERSRTEKEEKREKLKDNNNVEDVLRAGSGTGYDINRLMVALVRAAGFEADIVWLTTLRQGTFHRDLLDSSQLDAHVVLVRLGEKDLYLDPATRFAPYGYLTPDQTGVEGIRLQKEGVAYVKTPPAKSSDAQWFRKAELRLSAEGGLEGRVQAVFEGQAALSRRLAARDKDEAERNEDLEEEVKGWLPPGASVEVERTGPWESGVEPLVWEIKVTVPAFAVATGRRLLLPLGVFQSERKHPFEHAQRVQPVFFTYPWEETDEVKIELPAGYQVEGMPPPQQESAAFAKYEITPAQEGNSVRIKRRFVMEGQVFQVKHYPLLREFYNRVKAGDDGQVVLRAAEAGRQED